MECTVNMDLRIHYGEINRCGNATNTDWFARLPARLPATLQTVRDGPSQEQGGVSRVCWNIASVWLSVSPYVSVYVCPVRCPLSPSQLYTFMQ
jgi:hypothetical protein